MLGEAVAQIRIPAHVAESILGALKADQEKIDAQRQVEFDSASQRLSEIEGFKLQAYDDRLHHVIDESLWRTKSAEWRAEELKLRTVLESTSAEALGSKFDSVRKTFELAQIVDSKWVNLSNHERAKLAKIVLSNCSTDGVTLSFSYAKPFDLIVERSKNEEWRRERDSKNVQHRHLST